MKRAAFDDDVPLPPRGRAPAPASLDLRCRFCGDTAAFETLASFGARCGPCFAAYCREKPKWPAEPPRGVVPLKAGGVAWAYKLRWRHERGDRLTITQISMYREALQRQGLVGQGLEKAA